jgi:hypothetical protein
MLTPLLIKPNIRIGFVNLRLWEILSPTGQILAGGGIGGAWPQKRGIVPQSQRKGDIIAWGY